MELVRIDNREKHDDYVLATEESHGVEEFCEVTFDYVCEDWPDVF